MLLYSGREAKRGYPVPTTLHPSLGTYCETLVLKEGRRGFLAMGKLLHES